MITIDVVEKQVPAGTIHELQVTREDLQEVANFMVEKSKGKWTQADADAFVSANVADCGYVSLSSILKLYFQAWVTPGSPLKTPMSCLQQP